MALWCRSAGGKLQSYIPSSSAHHTGSLLLVATWKPQSLGELQAVPVKYQNFVSGLFFVLFNLPSRVKPLPRKERYAQIKSGNFTFEFAFNHLQLFIYLFSNFTFLNSCLVPSSECAPCKTSWNHIQGMHWESVSCLVSGQKKLLIRVWLCLGRERGSLVVSCFLFRVWETSFKILWYLKRFSWPDLFET